MNKSTSIYLMVATDHKQSKLVKSFPTENCIVLYIDFYQVHTYQGKKCVCWAQKQTKNGLLQINLFGSKNLLKQRWIKSSDQPNYRFLCANLSQDLFISVFFFLGLLVCQIFTDFYHNFSSCLNPKRKTFLEISSSSSKFSISTNLLADSSIIDKEQFHFPSSNFDCTKKRTLGLCQICNAINLYTNHIWKTDCEFD